MQRIVLGLIKDSSKILISRRKPNTSFAGFWELPGGKCNIDECDFSALKRELHEELGITLLQAKKINDFNHSYGDVNLNLSVWMVNKFSGNMHGAEGQDIIWCEISDIANYRFPPANEKIFKYLIKHGLI